MVVDDVVERLLGPEVLKIFSKGSLAPPGGRFFRNPWIKVFQKSFFGWQAKSYVSIKLRWLDLDER